MLSYEEIINKYRTPKTGTGGYQAHTITEEEAIDASLPEIDTRYQEIVFYDSMLPDPIALVKGEEAPPIPVEDFISRFGQTLELVGASLTRSQRGHSFAVNIPTSYAGLQQFPFNGEDNVVHLPSIDDLLFTNVANSKSLFTSMWKYITSK